MNPPVEPKDVLLSRIHDRSARVGVIGLGYVGLPLAVEFARAGFQVTGIDLNAGRVAIVTDHSSYDWERIGRQARLVVDTRNALKGVRSPRAVIVKL
jgi:UDP-N-acetyl-D-glucosamine dehydrogenase